MPHKRALLLILFVAGCVSASRESERRYTVLMGTNKAGAQIVRTRGREVSVDYEYTDRGRGPKQHTVLQLGEDSVPVMIASTGNDYLKQPIDERFSIENGVARWKNTAESGQAAPGGLYFSMYASPEELGVLARTLLRNGGTMPLLPAGTATIRRAGDLSLRGTQVVAYEIGGLGFTPLEVWLDDEQNFFGSVDAYQSTIREGFEGDVATMIVAQDARQRERGAALMKKLARRPGTFVVKNARIFDPRSGRISVPQSIQVEWNRIVAVGADVSGGEVIDAGGRIVLPGLWEMHTHLEDSAALLNIAAGVTSARDLGNDPKSILELKAKIDRGETIGPRLVLAGVVDGRGPFQAPTELLASNEDDARKAIDFLAANKYEGLKIYSSIDPSLVPFMTGYAHEKGLRVSGHIPAGMTAANAVGAGYDEIQHANMLFLNFMPDVKETRTPARFTEVANRGADLDLNSPEVRGFIEQLRARGVVIDPTVAIFERMFTARPGTVMAGYAAVADRLPPQVRRGTLTGGLPVAEGKDARYRASFARMLELIGALHKAGVTIVAGTDSMAGFTLQRELELYVQAGIPPAEVLRIATLVPAQILKRDKDLGTIEPGKLADFIIVDGDPTANISDIRRVVTVVKDGMVFDSAAVYRELGVN